MTQLVSPTDFNTGTLRFQKPINGGSPNTYRIQINASLKGQTIQSLLIATPTVFSFGVSPQANIGEKIEDDLSNVKYYTLPLCLHSKSGATASEIEFVDLFNKIVESCKTYMCSKELNEQLGKFGDDQITMSELKKFNPLHFKKEKGFIVDGTGPVLYPKLIMRKDGQSCVTTFSNGKDTHTNMRSLLSTRMFVRCALKIESIFVGSKVSLQVKICEVNYKTVDLGRERLLAHLPVECSDVTDDTNCDNIDDTVDVACSQLEITKVYEPVVTTPVAEPAPVVTITPVVTPTPVVTITPVAEPAPVVTITPVAEPAPVVTITSVVAPAPVLTTPVTHSNYAHGPVVSKDGPTDELAAKLAKRLLKTN
jgi:hypothetical protein